MILDLNTPAAVAVVGVLIIIVAIKLDQVWLGMIGGLIILGGTLTYCETTPAAQAERRAKAEAERQARIPHVIRDADGCKVYAFVAGSKEHYFTRCAGMVSTDRNYEVKKSCGKNCTKVEQHTETIVTKDE